MQKNIVCSGALFYAVNTKRFLFLQRTDSKSSGTWGLAGGKTKFNESAFEGLKREIIEEIGTPPAFKKVIPLELFTSNDQRFSFNTYVIVAQDEFLPKLNHEHSSYAWCAFEHWPKPLHVGLKNTLNNKSIKGKLQTILDLIV